MTPSAGDDPCPRCGSPARLTADGGLCPGCLLAGALDAGEPEPGEESPAPESCGGYLLEREIGRGGTGIVFLARLPGIARPCALKMPAARFAGPEEVRRFRIEIESAAALDHPHIVPLLSAGEDEGRPYLVMKYAAGGSLHSRLRERSGISAAQRREDVALMAKVARAIHFAHERGVLHRDLKPANILLDESGEPLVADFGLARLLHAPSGATLTGAALGTPAYMAPEQAAGAAVTTAADLYSLGAVLFHLLTDRPPFVATTPLETLRRVATEDAPDPRSLVPELDRDLATVCLKCLRREPSRRYATAAELADDLDRWRRGEPVRARAAGVVERGVKWARRHPAAAVLAAGSAAAAGVFAVLLATGVAAIQREKNEAVKNRNLAARNEGIARAAAETARQNAYAADLYLASRAIEDGQLGVARAMLARQVPEAGEADRRGFGWFALHDRCRGRDVRSFHDHAAAVTSVAFDPAGVRIASGGRDGRLFVHEVASGRQVLALPRADAPRGALEIPLMASLLARSPQLKRQVLAGAIPPDEMRMRGRPSKLGEVSTLAWSPDGRQLASGSTGAYLRLWDLPAGELAGLLPLTAVKQLAYAADGRHLVALQHVGDTYDLSVHRLEDLEEVRRVRDVQPCFALAGDQLAFVHSGGLELELQSVASGETTRRWPAGTGISLLAFSPDGETLHAADPWGRTLMAWRSHDGTPVIAGEVAPGAIRALAIQPGGRARVAAGTAQALVVQAFDSRSAPISLPGHEDEVLALNVSADGRWIASGGVDRSVRLWHFPGAAASPSAATDTGRPVAACPDGRCWLVAAADTAGVAGLDQELRLLPPAAAARVPLAFDRDGKRFLTWRADGRDLVAEWWDRATLAAAAQVRLRPGFDGPWTVNACADGRLLAVSAARTPVLVYETAGGTQVHRFPDAGIPPHRLEFSPDGEQLLVLAWPRQVRIGRIGGGWGGSFDLTTGTVGPAVFSPDGGLLASGGDDNAITLHDPASGRRLRELRGHRSQIVSLAFTPDGLTLASSAADRTLRLWDTRTWRELGVIDEDRLHGFIRFNAAGRRLLVVPWQEKPFRIPR